MGQGEGRDKAVGQGEGRAGDRAGAGRGKGGGRAGTGKDACQPCRVCVALPRAVP